MKNQSVSFRYLCAVVPALRSLGVAVCIYGCLLVSPLRADPGGFLDSTTYSLTSNSASRTILVTNYPTMGATAFEWFPASVTLVNRGATTGELLRVEQLWTSVTNIMNTNGTFTVTNLLTVINSDTSVSTNWIPTQRFYMVPSNNQLRIVTVCTNGEIQINREIAR